ncbi:MAG: cupredoxin domain-containing protein [Actinomycetota bacterium]|nr:cupredoxin domain-containing protein [Actinomycetota bacterium]
MRTKYVKKLPVVVVAVALLAFGCGSDDEESSPTSESPPVSLSGTVNDHGTETAGDELAMELDDNYFGPTYVQAKANQSIKLELENEGANIHTFTSETFGVDEEVSPGEKKTVTITAPGQGSVEFHCRFHQAGGMQGALFVR